ncbi:uncharacterized protein Bfra_008820 [Botrytis fragariae]|uniref:Uncharacterized protein n=1 Tax=Botrytis fragariae TaxID=1964551 RepID=A0A8H6AQ72_9HELO|nr:uncharacterized protein Bfra_008820 [Botrytis fragariae]KAF5871796.1 hypothetical protein Bfra_008820 [Botrytis fragariae]
MRYRECTELTQGWGIELEDRKAMKPIELYLLRHVNEEEYICSTTIPVLGIKTPDVLEYPSKIHDNAPKRKTAQVQCVLRN